MIMSEIDKYPFEDNSANNVFVDNILESELKYSCKDLYKAGIDNEAEMKNAILKGIQTIKQAGLIPQYHFKHIFVTSIETGKVYNDWRMSRIGFLLSIMNASGNNPTLNNMKIEIAKCFKHPFY